MDTFLQVSKEYGASGVYLIFLVVLWRQNIALQSRYEGLVERAIAALSNIDKELEKQYENARKA